MPWPSITSVCVIGSIYLIQPVWPNFEMASKLDVFAQWFSGHMEMQIKHEFVIIRFVYTANKQVNLCSILIRSRYESLDESSVCAHSHHRNVRTRMTPAVPVSAISRFSVETKITVMVHL